MANLQRIALATSLALNLVGLLAWMRVPLLDEFDINWLKGQQKKMDQRMQGVLEGVEGNKHGLEMLKEKVLRLEGEAQAAQATQGQAEADRLQRGCPEGILGCDRKRCEKSMVEALGQGGMSRCPDDVWALDMVKADPHPRKIIMNVGCNKGHDSIMWMQRWDQHHFWSLRDWSEGMSVAGRTACKINTNVPKPPKAQTGRGPLAVCVEALPSTATLLRKMRDDLGYTSAAKGLGRLFIEQAAATDQAAEGQTVQFRNRGPGSEQGRMVDHQDNSTVAVPLTTVDMLAQKLALPKVDILLVDVEGADPLVLKGAKRTLKSVRYLMFETHRDLKNASWSSTTIHSVVSDLDEQGFDCYWAGNSGKTYSITQCYDPSFESTRWANIACVRRNDVWWAALESRDPNSPSYRA